MLCVINWSIDVLVTFATGPFFLIFLEESFMKAMENIFGIYIAFY